jgi:hypothetical protein
MIQKYVDLFVKIKIKIGNSVSKIKFISLSESRK